MRRFWILMVLAVALTTGMVRGQQGSGARPSVSMQLEAAIKKETVDGDLKSAIELYKHVAASGNRAVAAQALLRMAGCYQKLGDVEAQRVYERLVKDFASQPEAVEARTRLDVMRSSGSANRGRGADVIQPFENSHALDALDPRGEFHISPDGTLAVLTRPGRSSPGSTIAIVARELASGKERVVTELANAELWGVAWTPDNRRIAFWTEAGRGSQIGRSELRVATLSTGNVGVVAATDRQPGGRWALAWAPDSQRLAFGYLASGATPRQSRTTQDVRLLTASSGEVRSLGISTEGPAPGREGFAWSPDGQRVAIHVIDQRQGIDEVQIVNVTSGQQTRLELPPAPAGARRLYSGPGDVGLPASALTLGAWTSQDEFELYESTAGPGITRFRVFLLPLRGEARTICDEAADSTLECTRFTHDARSFIVRNRSTQRLLIRDVKTGAERLLTSGSGEEDSPMSSPDGRLLSFLSNRDGRWGLYVVPVDQAPVPNPIRLAVLDKRPDVRGITARHWTENGRLAFGFYYQDRNLLRLDWDPATASVKGQPIRLNTDDSERTYPAVSPDSRLIASWSRDGVKTGIVITDRNGAGARLVLEHALRPSAGIQPGGTGVPLVWRSPDEIVFYEWSPRAGEKEGFRILKISQGVVTTLPGSENEPYRWEFSRGTYVPSQDAIVFCTGDNVGKIESVKVRSLSDGSERTLATATSLGSMTVSADGRWIAYSHLAFTDAVRGAVPAEIRVVPFDGSGDRAVATTSANIRDYSRRRFQVESWATSPPRLLFRNESGQLWMMDVTSGVSTPLLDQGATGWNEAVWAPDGSFLVLRSYSERSAWSAFEGVTYQAVIRLMSAPGRR